MRNHFLRPLALVITPLLYLSCGKFYHEKNPNNVAGASTNEVSFSNVNATVFSSKCVSCHRDGGSASSSPFTSYTLIASRAKSIRARVFTFADMPPSGSPQLTAAESSLLLKWLDAGTPEFANQSPSGVSTGTGTGTGTGTDPLPVGPKFSEIKDKIFAAHDCLDCHGPQQTRRKQIHTVAKLLESGYIVVGEPQNSPLYTALIRDESDSKFMPRGGDRLPESEIKLIEQWIKDGAPDDTVSPGP